jgi:choice-of-anchor C domain-containing protein
MIRIATGAFLVMISGAALAAPFQNGSFESGPPNPCNTFNVPAGSTIITGWTVSVGNIDWESAPACGWQPSDGSNSLDLVGASAGGIGGIQQTFDTVPGVTYQVLFDLAGNYGAPPVIKPLAVTINGVTTNFTFDTTGRSALNMGWTQEVITFTATGPSSTINFVSDVSGSGGTLNAGAALDNVRIAPLGAAGGAVAVPIDWAHLAAAVMIVLAGLLLFKRRRAFSRW